MVCGRVSFRTAVLMQLKDAWADPDGIHVKHLAERAIDMGAVTDVPDIARAADTACRAFEKRLNLPVQRVPGKPGYWRWYGGLPGRGDAPR